MMKDIIIAIDGFSGCGKSTLAKDLAKFYNYTYIDSGAMYRAVTLYSLEKGIIKEGVINTIALEEKIHSIKIDFRKEYGQQNTYLNDHNVELKIRSLEVANHVSAVSRIKFVRERMVALQRELGINKRIVMDGRDIGTVVFPDAELKLFMTASIQIRAERRLEEYVKQNIPVSIEEIIENLEKRDEMDSSRTESPLQKASDAIVIDNTSLTREDQLQMVVDMILKIFK